MDAKWRPVRRQKPTRRQEQEIGLVQPHHLLHGALPGGRGANEFGPVVPPQHPGEELSAARRAGIDQERQPFLARRGCPSRIQQRAPLAALVERQGCTQRQKQLSEAKRLLEASALIVTQVNGQGTEWWEEIAERLPQVLQRPAPEKGQPEIALAATQRSHSRD